MGAQGDRRVAVGRRLGRLLHPGFTFAENPIFLFFRARSLYAEYWSVFSLQTQPALAGLRPLGWNSIGSLLLSLPGALDFPFSFLSVRFQKPLPEPDVHLSMHPALPARDLVCLDRLSPCGSRPPPYGRGRSRSPAPLPRVSGITLTI